MWLECIDGLVGVVVRRHNRFPQILLIPIQLAFALFAAASILTFLFILKMFILWLHVTAGMRGCMGATKEMIHGNFFLVRFKIAGVKLENGLDIKIA